MAEQGVPAAQLLPVAGGEPVRLSDDVTVTVFPSQHSCVWTQSGSMSGADEVCLGDLGVTHQERLARFGDSSADGSGRSARRGRAPHGVSTRTRAATAARSST